jgi:hypothetical protein
MSSGRPVPEVAEIKDHDPAHLGHEVARLAQHYEGADELQKHLGANLS